MLLLQLQLVRSISILYKMITSIAIMQQSAGGISSSTVLLYHP
jgi:hypothetical protein